MLRQLVQNRAALNAIRRCFATSIEAESETEKKIAEKIQQGLKSSVIRVADTSGGCGAMYSIEVVSEEFAGISIVKQHQLVTRLLKDEISQWHGFQLVTKAPAQ